MKKLLSLTLMAVMLPSLVLAETTLDSSSQIELLLRQIRELQAKVELLIKSGATLSSSNTSSGGTSASVCAAFNRNLQIGMQGEDVRRLHELLKDEGLTVNSAESAAASYGESTASLVTRYQEKYKSEILAPTGLSSGTGFVGPATRARLYSNCVNKPAVPIGQTYLPPVPPIMPYDDNLVFTADRTSVASGEGIGFYFSVRGGADYYNLRFKCPEGIEVMGKGGSNECQGSRDYNGSYDNLSGSFSNTRAGVFISTLASPAPVTATLEAFVGGKSIAAKSLSFSVGPGKTEVPPTTPTLSPVISYVQAKAGNQNEAYAGEPLAIVGSNLGSDYGVNGTYVYINNIQVPITQFGNTLLYVTAPYHLPTGNYALWLQNNKGNSNTLNINFYGKTITPTIPPNIPAPTIDFFSVNATTITKGQYVVLAWNTKNAETVALLPLEKSYKSGPASDAFAPTQTTTYTLVAKSIAGAVNKSVTVTVLQPQTQPPVPVYPYPTPSTPTIDRIPVGNLDAVSCEIIGGWAYDPDTAGEPIAVHLYDGGAGVGSLIWGGATTGLRPDVNTAYGISGNHGFTIATPASLKDGKPHYVYAYGINSNSAGKNVDLAGTGKVLTCPAVTALEGVQTASILNSLSSLIQELSNSLK